MNDTVEKFRIDVLRDEIKSYEAIEQWGATLFLGAISLASKQIVDWVYPSDPYRLVVVHAWLYLLPALVGLTAFIFLRFVNFRTRRARNRLYVLVGLARQPQRTFGTVGWLMAAMPLLLGYGASWYLSIGNSESEAIFCWVAGLGIATIIVALVLFLCVQPLPRNEEHSVTPGPP